MTDDPTGVPASARRAPDVHEPARAADLLAGALAAFGLLADLAETVEDEWTYVTRLVEVGRARLQAAAPQPHRVVTTAGAAAIAALVAEVGRITDPHRAIDWLSTFPAVAELALRDGSEAPRRQPAPGA